MSETRVHAIDVTVERGGRCLLDKASLEIAAGEVVGIVGPNGAGKSTLLRVLSGDLAPSSGRARLLGVDVDDTSLRGLARIRSYVGPQTVSDVSFRVREVVAMGRYPHRMETAESETDVEIVADAMARSDIAHLAAREIRTLSSGEQQRVALARAIAQQTPVMLLDEPTSALDIGHQELVMLTLRDLAVSGVSVVSVLHDLNLAAAHADRVVLLDEGHVAAVGTPSDVLTSARLSAAYQQAIQVIDHPYRDCPLVLTTG